MNTQKHVFYGAEGRYVAEVDFDRVTAERDALQQLLNARDEGIDRLRETIRYFEAAHKDSQQHVSKVEVQLTDAQRLLSASSELLGTISMHTTMSPSQWCDSFQREVKDRIQKINAVLEDQA